MKLMMVVAASVCAVSLSARAAEEVEKPVETEEEETQFFSVGADLDFFSAYVWRNAVQNDEMVMQPCVWADFTGLDPLTFGFYISQNYDLTENRRRGINRYALTETDYNLHIGYTPWTSDDEDYSLAFEIGHDWYTYQGVRRENKSSNPDSRELYVKTTFANPVVDVYGQASWMYRDFGDYKQGVHAELGFNREYEVCDTVTVGADWNVSFGDGNYLSYLFGGSSNPYWEDVGEEEPEWEMFDDFDKKEGGFGGTTVKFYASWQLTDWMALKGTVAYTGLLNQKLRNSIGDQGEDYDFYGDSYPRDLVWGGLSLNIEF